MNAPSSPSREHAVAVVRRLRDAGHVAYFAGGCVRDELLGLPAKDFDVATDAPPDKVRSLFRNTQAVGASFGVILVRIERSQIEVATFRTDGRYTDGRRPDDVRFSTAQEDAQRRDFTINGMFLDPLTGDVVDYVGGQADLAARRLRAIGNPDERFTEDHLRLLRAVRFAARFGLKIEEATDAAIIQHAPLLARISPERIAEELRRMLTPATRDRAYHLLREYGLLDVILRFLPAAGTQINPAVDGLLPRITGFTGTEPISFSLALAAASLEHRGRTDDVLHLTSPTEVRRTCAALRQALKISNDEERAITETLMIGPLIGDQVPAVAPLKRFLATPHSRDAWLLMRALGKDALVGPVLTQLSQTDCAPPPLVTGDDLAAAGMRPGPAFKRILDSVYDAQLEDRVKSKDEALELAKRMA
ncbi:MAG TPA: CCA tRNA nucleotidyltransferase [Tepidisphaeraceae bacterium]|jgi:poly(A) polymerase|nr:CCA tRNA nucleotidyltransferase [Tepidisphaeraceae bacterium]